MPENKEKALVVGLNVAAKDYENVQDSMVELAALAEAAGAEVVGSIVQNRAARDVATYVGKGKLLEIREEAVWKEATLVIFNDELSGTQLRNIEEILELKVLDRTALILDIFAQRALSREGKLQVELAQLKYRLPRLHGLGKQLSRTGGGIGTRGPGEQKLETDRRHIMNRISEIKKELEQVKKHRSTQRAKRLKSELPLVALVGYTNSGKSSLLNELIKTHQDYSPDKEVLAEDKLFASLDVTLRKAALPNKQEFLVVDTVGFVSKLPHMLVEAFKATLEEVKYADLILHVIDSSNENNQIQVDTTLQVLQELGAYDKPMINVYNKIDLLPADRYYHNTQDQVYISVKEKWNLDKLYLALEQKLQQKTYKSTLNLPFTRGDILNTLKNKYSLTGLQYNEHGIEVEVVLDEQDYRRYREYICDSSN